MSNIQILDGGMGRELARRGAPFKQPEWSALALMEKPTSVQAVHEDYINAGADIITTNSYAVVPFHIGEDKFANDGKALIELSGKLAQQAKENTNKATLIAGSIPPLFGSYRADLFEADKVADVVSPLIEGLAEYADVWLMETQSLIAEPQAVIPLFAKLADERPIWVSFTLEDDIEDAKQTPHLRSGETVREAVKAMLELGVTTILFNCCQPEVIEQALLVANEVIAESGMDKQSIQTGAYANAFPPQPKEATANDGLDELRKDLNPDEYLHWAKVWIDTGATIIGGCCGIGPEHIEKMAKTLK